MKRVGVLGNFFFPHRAGSPSPFGAYYINRSYSDAFVKQFVLPVSIPCLDSTLSEEYYHSFLESIDGLVLTGGFDIPASFYGQQELPDTNFTYDEFRTRFELKLLELAENYAFPILGICLGLQLYNVFRGGSLLQDIKTQRPNTLEHTFSNSDIRLLAHQVNLQKGTCLAGWYQEPDLMVNSSHHQAVDKLGAGLVINALSPDGIIEGLESTDGRFVGVQWHPEALHYQHLEHQRLFAAFVDKI